MLGTGSNIVINAIVGWDTRPRHKAEGERANYYALASPQEFAAHLKTAVSLTRDYKDKCESATVLVYSWNECDEGGGVLPC